jgi:hypothetical protein
MIYKYSKIIHVLGVIFIFGTTFCQDANKLSSKANNVKANKTNIDSVVKKTTLLYSNEVDSLKIQDEKPSEYEGLLNSRKEKKAE